MTPPFPPDDPLTAAVRELVGAARDRALDPNSRDQLADAVERLSGPLRLAIAGRVKAGKSTLLNALVGEELAPTDAGECTKLVTWYIGGHAAKVTAVHKDGRREQRPFSREGGALEVDLGGPAEAFDHLEVSWPSSRLRDVTLVDTPGIASLSTEVSERTSTLLSAEDDRPPVVDAVLYLFRHSHASDVRFLEAFHDDELGRGTPLNAVGVLSRPDEIGSCRLDALTVAARVADRYERDSRIHRLCPLVLPVAGLLGQAGTTLREEEYRALATIAALPDAERNELLLTADRLLADDTDVRLTPLERGHLADRLGLFGVRLSVTLIRDGTVRSATELAKRLATDSKLEELRGVLVRQFLERSKLLRARSALAVVRAVLRRGGCSGRRADRRPRRGGDGGGARVRGGPAAHRPADGDGRHRRAAGGGDGPAAGRVRAQHRAPAGGARELLGSAAARRRVHGVGPVAAGGVVTADEPRGPDRGARRGPHLRGDRGEPRPGPRLSGFPGPLRAAGGGPGRRAGRRLPRDRRGRPAGRDPRRSRRPGRRCCCRSGAG